MSDFSKRMRKRAESVRVGSAELVRSVAQGVLAGVVHPTPVDTGRARSNWQVEVGSAPVGEVTTVASASETIAAGVAKAQGYTYGKGGIFIANNLQYIERLNNGWSHQAPAGFIEKGILAGARVAQNSKILKD